MDIIQLQMYLDNFI